MFIWSLFKSKFQHIIEAHPYYHSIRDFMIEYDNNVLLYGSFGFPTDLFIDEVLRKKYQVQAEIQKKECQWNKDITYYSNQHFLEFDLMHPTMPKKFDQLCKCIISVIKHKNINDSKHLIIVKHLDLLNDNDFSSFRIILERYSKNAYFICTTHKLDKIDMPVKSRFSLIRMPLFTHEEIKDIFQNYLNTSLNMHLSAIQSRNIIQALFIADIQDKECDKDFCILHFPPINQLVKQLDKRKNNLELIRQFSYKCFQYNISISDIAHDLMYLLPRKHKLKIIQTASEIEYDLCLTNKCREPIYIESFLCQALL